MSTVNLDCKLDLKAIALQARNAEYNPKVGDVCGHGSLSLSLLGGGFINHSAACSLSIYPLLNPVDVGIYLLTLRKLGLSH